MPYAEITAALASGKKALEVAELIYKAKDCFKDAAAQMQMADLMVQLSDTNLKLAKIEHLMLEKERDIEKLKQSNDVASRVVYISPSYWLNGADGDGREGPFCQRCWDVDRLLVRLQGIGGRYDPHLFFAACKSRFDDPTRTAQPLPTPRVHPWT